ncbi:hypothetical protein THAOC_22255, partial [Thalassiosira oceanica]
RGLHRRPDDERSSDGGAVRVREPDAAQVVREILAGHQAEDGTGQVPERAVDVRDGPRPGPAHHGRVALHDRRQGARAAGGAHVLRPHRVWRQPEGRGA